MPHKTSTALLAPRAGAILMQPPVRRMALAADTRLGPYEIVAVLGAGGMGEVYRARDTRLERTVAIKVLPADLSTDPERRARFEREARTIAALNHPHICMLHDVGEADVPSSDAGRADLPPSCDASADRRAERVTYLVMEYVHGETLAQRLRKGPLPVPQALEIGAQIAEALDAAHQEGIVHRDLKPSNVMLAGGSAGTATVKLLDFGLAKLRSSGVPAASSDSTLTVREPLTQAGEVLGTRPYMAPEQVEGKATDARTDLWALGCVLYQMVAGQPAFRGDSVASITAAILAREPEPLAAWQPLTPPALEHVVRKCLAKTPQARWQSARDVADELQWVKEGASALRSDLRPRPRHWRYAAVVTAAGVALGSFAAALWLRAREGPAPPAAVVHSLLDVQPANELNSGGMRPTHVVTPGGSRTALAWTPDGQALVFVGREGSVQRLYLRRLDATEARPLANTEGARMPAVSADGRWVAFWADGAIKKVPIGGGPATTLAANARISSGLSWDSKGGVFFDDGARRILRVAPDGGPPTTVTGISTGEVFHTLPHALPRDGVLLFTVRRTHWSWGREEVVALNLVTGERTTVLRDATDARFVPTGHLVFMRRGQLLAVAFDDEQLAVHGRPEVLLDGVAQSLTSGNLGDNVGAGQFAVAASGTLAWVPGAVMPYPRGKLVAVDRHGRKTALPAPERSYVGAVRTSPDGRRLMVGIRSLTEVGLWVLDLDRGTLNPVVRDGEAMWSVWSPDGAAILFTVLKDGQWFVARQPVDVAAPAQTLANGEFLVSSLASDGRHLAVAPRRPGDITVLALDTASAAPQPFLQTGELQSEPVFSPDGRWLAYTSNSSGQQEVEVYVRPYPGPGPPLQVSVDGGWCSIWHPDGRELFYVTGKEFGTMGAMMAVEFTAGPRTRIGTPKRLFDFDRRRLDLSTVPVRAFDLSRDGHHFYTVEYGETGPAPVVTHIFLVQNWFEELKAKVPVK